MRSTRHLSVSAMMDPGLSRRARSALDGLGPALEGTAPASFDPFGNTIDLSCGGNEVLYPELQKFLGDVVRDVGAVEVCSLRFWRSSGCVYTSIVLRMY